MSLRVSNDSVSALICGFAIARWADEKALQEARKKEQPVPDDERENVIVWLDRAPNHPKVLNAIWATLVKGTGSVLRLSDYDSHWPTYSARGLNRRYRRLTADAPRLAGRARPKHLRLIAPEASRVEDHTQPFVVLDWPGLLADMVLAAMLEQGTPYPVQIAWGDYLLTEAIARGYARALITAGNAPQGYLIDPAPWPEIISNGVKSGQITLAGSAPAGVAVRGDSIFDARRKEVV
jgi:hypothetical protein